MKPMKHRPLSTAIVAAALCLQPLAARADIVATDQLAAPRQADGDRARVEAFLDRAGVRERLQTMGLSGIVAKDRVAALSDQEVHGLAQKIDALPAGGNFGSFSNDQLIIVLLIAILVAIIV